MKDLAAAVQQEVERKTKNASTSISMINLMQPIDIRNGEFTQSALRMESHELKAVLQRDDLVCNSEHDVLVLVLNYIKQKVQTHYDAIRKDLLSCVRLDQLEDETLISLSTDQFRGFEGKGLMNGFENQVVQTLANRLQQHKSGAQAVTSAPRKYMKQSQKEFTLFREREQPQALPEKHQFSGASLKLKDDSI